VDGFAFAENFALADEFAIDDIGFVEYEKNIFYFRSWTAIRFSSFISCDNLAVDKESLTVRG
jgi:hypothetical protein